MTSNMPNRSVVNLYFWILLFVRVLWTSYGETTGSMSKSIESRRVTSVHGQQQLRQLGSFKESLMVGSPCTTKESTSGVCRGIQNCSYVVENLHRIQWAVCAWEGHVPVVCCPGRREDVDTPTAGSGPIIKPRPSLDQSNAMDVDQTEVTGNDEDDQIAVQQPTSSFLAMSSPSSSSSSSSPWRPSLEAAVVPTPILFAGESGRPFKPSQFFAIKNVNGTLLFSVRNPDKSSSSPSFSSLKKQRCGVQSYSVSNGHDKRRVRRLRPNGKFLELDRSTSSIVGGMEAAIGSFPWMTAIFKTTRIGNGYRHSFLCGGSILSPSFVITAAHCFNRYDDPMMFTVRVGDQNLKTSSNVGAVRPEDVAVQTVTIHPDYEPPRVYNDVALLRLKRNLLLDGNYLLPICLPDPQIKGELNFTDTEATVIGFGSSQLIGKMSSGTLQQVSLPIVDNELCEEAYTQVLGMSIYFPKGITPQLLCAGYEDGGKDACQGDSGGPLMMLDDDGHWNLIGIVSVGRGCAEPGFPGIYTRIEYYVSWIKRVLAT